MDGEMNAALAAGNRAPIAGYQPKHFLWEVAGKVATITLNRPERKNPLTFESYAELRDLFRALEERPRRQARRDPGAGENFCSGGDVHEIIGPLTKLDMPGLLTFTRMTGDVVKAMRACPQPIVAAIDGVCAGAGAIIAMASDLRVGTTRSKVAFLFTRVGLAGCDMGACTHPAADHRPGARLGSALHRPRDERGGGATPGASSTGSARPRRCAGEAHGARHRARRRAVVRPRR